ncbi:RNB domain-containing ribonuclease [Tessaracoccus rhinocerotis]|uniref:RNB domain-containing ribonuclease n=1 Tax=Tessaracoccus rhinocerotis TaxID=1689449 RepID=A0A553K254_9ACTN|nr:RNB domain-containing ribonuclease [Tessaracoccus rhinocerotis]TRY18792.1 RNB domain-containing ribonuclease [Tessaracoccus rhinocerotis]
MPARHIEFRGVPEEVRKGLDRLRASLELPEGFPTDVDAQAEHLAASPPEFPDHKDMTDVEFVTVDPPDAMDLDQALHIRREGEGYRVRYAIADVGAWVEPGSPVDREAHLRGQTLYAPSAKVPLHPRALSEGAASLLADGVARPAMVWTHLLDAKGEVTATTLERAMVVNRAKLSYEGIQADLDAGNANETVRLLAEVGPLRERIEAERGGISLNLPDQEIVTDGHTWLPVFRELVKVEDWNAQISLLTGIAAADLMISGGVGILRTLPPAEDHAVDRLRRAARTLGVEWPKGQSYPDFVRSLHPSDPREHAVLVKCTMLFRGAGYLAFDGEVPDANLEHSALATPYAHTTAPLRRLVDRFVLEICHALANDLPVPQWAREALDTLPEQMQASGRKAGSYERGVVDLAEALVLSDRVGEIFEAVLIDVYPKNSMGTFQIADPAVEAELKADRRDVGTRIRVRLDKVDLVSGRLTFSHPG